MTSAQAPMPPVECRVTVHGNTSAEIHDSAAEAAAAFYGDTAHRILSIDARAVQSASGQVLIWEADVTAIAEEPF